ncbi:hypothetical protein SDC9_172434 [bioreactor metagenome]|uniref:Uncharacterized protein n=1 Tax=bioreactor metagenome TaxID=1076179 RepID=A0A645GDP8_9ZZZZ
MLVMSPPAANTLSPPVSTMQRTVSSDASSVKRCDSSACNSSDKALVACGRFRRSKATPPSRCSSSRGGGAVSVLIGGSRNAGRAGTLRLVAPAAGDAMIIPSVGQVLHRPFRRRSGRCARLDSTAGNPDGEWHEQSGFPCRCGARLPR